LRGLTAQSEPQGYGKSPTEHPRTDRLGLRLLVVDLLHHDDIALGSWKTELGLGAATFDRVPIGAMAT